MKIAALEHTVVYPFKRFGIESPFFAIHLDTIINSSIALLLVLSMALLARWMRKRSHDNLLSFAVERAVVSFRSLCLDTVGDDRPAFFVAAALFTFVLMHSVAGLLPWVEESTADLNTALAAGTVAFLYPIYRRVRAGGILKYIGSMMQPLFIMFPINLLGEIAKLISTSLRLFGNVLGGAILMSLLMSAVAPLRPLLIKVYGASLILVFLFSKTGLAKRFKVVEATNKSLESLTFALVFVMMFFGLFEGAIQAFVITMLMLTYLALGVKQEED